MNRRDFHKVGLSAMGAFAIPTDKTPVVLEDDKHLISFDPESGAITRLEYKPAQWVIHSRPELGTSFRLLAPLPERRYNFVLGQRQRARKVQKLSEQEVTLEWTDLESEHGGVLPITFSARVSLTGGALMFRCSLSNDSNLTVETIDYPYLGELRPAGHDRPMHTEHMWYGNLVSDEIYPDFKNEKGYWGVDFPTKTIESKQSLFCLLQSAAEGIYVEMDDATCSYLLEFTFEQHPGVVESIQDNVPKQDSISGVPVHLEFRTCHFLFAHPHSTTQLAPVIMRGYLGDWHAGVDLYKLWRATWFQTPRLPGWVEDVHSWQQLQINSPEEDYRIPYRDLVQYGEECAKNGVRAIQLVGWNHGGQDRGDPSQDTDPGLGTRQDLLGAISRIQSMGVKIILFGKLNWADKTTEWYKRELYEYQATDPYGIPYEQGGYSYFTPTQLAGINNRRRAVMDVASPAYRDLITKEFQRLLELGATGWLFDEVCHHGPVDYSFSPDHGYIAPKYIYSGDMPLARELRSAADALNPQFIFAGEGPQDWLMQYYPVSYFRINDSSRAVCRYIDSRAPLMIAVTGFDDREMLNLALLNRYIISYEPYNFKGHLTAFPLTLAYGQKIDALRRKYREWLWDAEFRDTLGARVTANGTYKHSVFVSRTGKRAVVVVNREVADEISFEVEAPGAGPFLLVTPEQTEGRPASGAVHLAARSAAVLIET